ncbi:MAG: NAD(+)/NADH kinase [Bacteroidota bacterium]
MKLGIVPNREKENILQVVELLINKLNSKNVGHIISESFRTIAQESEVLKNCSFMSDNMMFSESDIIVSIGGDGTVLTTGFLAKDANTPLLGINFGKLGFLAEYEIKNLDRLIDELINKEYQIEERITLSGNSINNEDLKFFAINDIVIDKGKWPKMIEVELKVDNKYVSTFLADGIIISTPTGSTGYSLSTGGPIVAPKTKAITISPISPHTLTIRPLVLSSDQNIRIKATSHHESLQISCDGQRVSYLDSPSEVQIFKSDNPIKLVRTNSISYFDILRKKLYWGIDIRSNLNNGDTSD